VAVVGIDGTVAIVEHLRQNAAHKAKVVIVLECGQQAYTPAGLDNLLVISSQDGEDGDTEEKYKSGEGMFHGVFCFDYATKVPSHAFNQEYNR
jgi:hypothetical protein